MSTWEQMPFEEFKDGRRGVRCGLKNFKMAAIFDIVME